MRKDNNLRLWINSIINLLTRGILRKFHIEIPITIKRGHGGKVFYRKYWEKKLVFNIFGDKKFSFDNLVNVSGLKRIKKEREEETILGNPLIRWNMSEHVLGQRIIKTKSEQSIFGYKRIKESKELDFLGNKTIDFKNNYSIYSQIKQKFNNVNNIVGNIQQFMNISSNILGASKHIFEKKVNKISGKRDLTKIYAAIGLFD